MGGKHVFGCCSTWWPHERVNHHITDWPVPGPECNDVNLHSWLDNECLGSFVLSWQRHQRHHRTNTERYHSACIFKCIISGPASHVGIWECIYMVEWWMQPVEDNPYHPMAGSEISKAHSHQTYHSAYWEISLQSERDVDIYVHIERYHCNWDIIVQGSGWSHDEDNSYDLSHNYWRSGSPRMCTSVPYSQTACKQIWEYKYNPPGFTKLHTIVSIRSWHIE